MKENLIKYNNLIIYYFSGTGNARNAARWIHEVAEYIGIQSRLISIDRFESIDPPELTGNSLIGFLSPTHGFNLPPIALKFISKFPKLKNCDVFILNTRGGLKLSKLFLPGLSGLAQILPAMILRLKGFPVVGMQPLDLPSNWLLLHPALRPKVIDSMYDHYQNKVNRFALNLFEGKRRYKALLSLPIDLALIPIALGYYFFGRFFLSKTFITTDDCNLCMKCINQCPVKAINLVNDRPFWSYRCESCMRCVNNCPERAIETMQPFAISMFFISSMLVSPFLILVLKEFGIWEMIKQSVLTEKIWSVIYTFIFLVLVFLSYRILHFLMRYKIINWIVTYTSLSTYKFWRRYRPPES